MNVIIRTLIYFLVVYGAFVLVVFFLQKKMIYFPDQERLADPYLQSTGLQLWPGGETEFKGYANRQAPSDVRGTVIVFHGNAGSAGHRSYYVHALVPLGFHVILAEYPGYGGRPGPLGEAPFVADAKAIVHSVHARFGAPVYLLGESMGCGVVAAVAADAQVPVDGLVLVTPWDSLPDLAQTLYWYLPARWLTRDKYDNVRNLQSFRKPVALAIAAQDRIVPNRHSMRLYESLAAPKRLWRFEGAGHNSWPTHPSAGWWREAMDFVTSPR